GRRVGPGRTPGAERTARGGAGVTSAAASSSPCLISAPNQAPGPFRGSNAPTLKEGPTGGGVGVVVEGSGFEGVPPGLKGGGRCARTSAAEHAKSATTATTVRRRLRILRKSYRSAGRAGSASGSVARGMV